jgi:hypothetical protein
MFRPTLTLSCLALVASFAAGCGSSGSPSSGGTTTPTASTASTASGSNGAPTTPGGSQVGALSAEAKSAATGDIPDTQVFLTYRNPSPAYRISYPEGWTRKGSTSDVTFSNNNNIVHIAVTTATTPTLTGVSAEMNTLKQRNPTLTFTPPKVIQVKSGQAIKVTYTTRSAPNSVTGKSVLLIVDRYELSRGGKRATVDLGTAKGVDNVDAYRMMINSFRWQ